MDFLGVTLSFLLGVLLSLRWSAMPWILKAVVAMSLLLLLLYLILAAVIYVLTRPGS